jgi:alkanesulfonate monooxygenase SsuD/methylene tetrahydromethanopterin reductase-like flavin-dependent oxidoreductase (luciferase family)
MAQDDRGLVAMSGGPGIEVGVALPQMATGLDRARFEQWCAGIDAGPFSSISAGERITFHNLEGITACAAAAALTSRVRVLANVIVLPWHRSAMIAKQLATIDVLSGGRLDVAVGVGGRGQDYLALEVADNARHQRLDAAIDTLRGLWSGAPAADGKPVGPEPVQPGGPRVFASAMGPKSLARAARWAVGVSGFSLLADPGEMQRSADAARAAWAAAGREGQPVLATGSFVCLGSDAAQRLRDFAYTYLEVFSPDLAAGLAAAMTLHTPEALRSAMQAAAEAGYHEFIVVPATSDPAMLHELAAVVAS